VDLSAGGQIAARSSSAWNSRAGHRRPGVNQLSAAAVPLVTVTDKFVAGWMGNLINFEGVVVSAFGASLACAVGASRILFALGRDAGPVMLRRTSRGTGAPEGALIWVGRAACSRCCCSSTSR
jgi:amino acid transporter